jgi:hypothetical protein
MQPGDEVLYTVYDGDKHPSGALVDTEGRRVSRA